MTGSYADRLNVMRRYGAPPENPFYALFLPTPTHLIKLRLGHMKKTCKAAPVSLRRRRLGQRKILLDANVIDKRPGVGMKPARCFCPTGRASDKQQGLFTPSFFSSP